MWVRETLASDGVEEIFKMGRNRFGEVGIFADDYLARIDKTTLPNTIGDFKKVNKVKGLDFSDRFKTPVDRYNDRKEQDVLRSVELEGVVEEIMDLLQALKKEKESFGEWVSTWRKRPSTTSSRGGDQVRI